MDILIVGAGPTGLTAAIELVRQGIKPTIIDKRSKASALSRAVGITPRSLQLLSHSGVHKTLIKDGIPMTGLRVYQQNDLRLEMDLQSDTSFHPHLICLPQDRTETIMADWLKSHDVDIHYDLALTDLTTTDNQIEVAYSDGTKQLFDHVIGADGVRSTVREKAGIAYHGYDLTEKWSVADVDLNGWSHPNCLTIVQAGPNRIAVIVPIGKDRYRLVANTDNAIKAMPLSLDILNIRREGAFTISVRMADTMSTGKVHLAGDAAHCHSPVGGRGMNLGITDACELAQRIVNNDISGYTTSRHKDALSARKFTERGRLMSTGPNIFRRVMFRALLKAANILPPLRRKIGSFIVEF